MNPMMLDFSDHFETERLFIRAQRRGDGKQVNEGIIETYEDLKLWLPWADHVPTVDETEEFSRRSAAQFIAREMLGFNIFLKDSNLFAGCIAFNRIDWRIPKFEIGYWIRKNLQVKGYATEAVEGMTNFAFLKLNAKRVEIRCDPKNSKSKKVPEKLGFKLEGILRNDFLTPSGEVRNTAVYSKIE